MVNKKELGETLKAERLKQGLSFYEVCKRSVEPQIAHHQVLGLEKGERNSSISMVIEYSRILGLQMSFTVKEG